MIRLSAEIYADENIYEITENLIRVQFSGQDRGDPLLPSWGIKSNSGSLEMYDTDGTLEKLSREGTLQNSQIRINLGVGSRTTPIGVFYVSGAIKDRQTSKMKIEFQDILMSWNQKQMSGYYYNYYPRTIYISQILENISKKADITLKTADEETLVRVSNILMPNPTLSSGSLWAMMSKICEASSCYIYCNELGEPTIYYGGDT